MLISELRRTSPPPNVSAALNYLCDLANETGVDITTWDVNKVFGDELKNSPREINKRFFSQVRMVEYLKRATLSEAVLENILANQHKRPRNVNEQRILNSIEAQNRHIRSYQSTIRTCIQTIQDLRVSLSGAKSLFDLRQCVEEVLALGFYEFVPALPESNLLFMVKTPEIVLSKGPDKEGRDFKTNFGRITFGLTIDGHVKALRNFEQPDTKVDCQGYFFPFIDDSGIICWGSGAELAADLESKMKYAELFQLLIGLLTNYEGGHPYRTLESFFINGTDRDGKTAPWLKSLTPEQRKIYGLDEKPPITRIHCNGSWEDEDGNTRDCEEVLRTEWFQDSSVIECEQCGSEYHREDYL
jgi:hypothetical protein